METAAQLETVENELPVFHRSHCAWKTRQKTAEFPTVSTASTAGHSDEEKRKTIAGRLNQNRVDKRLLKA